jgi:hypothetical protein
LRDNKLGNNENDSFTPVRDTGCLYKGKDEPGMRHIQPGEHVRFRFEFSGGPVDRRDRQRKIGRWSEWAVHGDYTFTPEPPDKPKDKPPKSDETKPRPYKGPRHGSAHFHYGGGIEEDPTIGDTYPVRLYFMSGGRQHHADNRHASHSRHAENSFS